ncbi:MAG: PIG-L deacetylase family protein [Hyphomicrobiaceae bacterium]|nr:PIG-L family deacetylase [Hyphomicrobiaceae bacterium]
MLPLSLYPEGRPLRVLALGAHSDDIEIGAGGTILTMLENRPESEINWCVLSATGEREHEARSSASAFLKTCNAQTIECAAFRDGFFPYQGAELKAWFEQLKKRFPNPDVVLTHRRDDAHQDHREVSALTWNTFRDAIILEYEIPKWDGDLCQPNSYVALTEKIILHKSWLLLAHFGTQRSKDWFDVETFRGLARVRGVECRAPERYAEAFVARKLRLM